MVVGVVNDVVKGKSETNGQRRSWGMTTHGECLAKDSEESIRYASDVMSKEE